MFTIKKWFDDLYAILYIITHPSYWVQVEEYSKKWDRNLRNSMNEYKFEYYDSYYSLLGYRKIWIENHPYASFTHSIDGEKVRPRRRTIYKAYIKMLKDIGQEG